MLSLIVFLFVSNASLPVRASEVPEVLYHYGDYEILQKNVRARSVPQADWDQFIMGDRTRYQQKWYRRGLYGSSHPGYAAWFMDIDVGRKTPWFMAIHLEKACQSGAYDMNRLFDDARVIEYFNQRRNLEYLSIDDYRNQCFKYYPEYKQWVALAETMGGSQAVTPCENFLNRLFDDLKARVVIDNSWTSSWYLRDRSCIRTIEGTPSEVLKMVSTIDGYGSTVLPNGENRQGTMQANATQPLLFFKILLESAELTIAELDGFEAALQKMDLINPSYWSNAIHKTKPNWVSHETLKLLSGYKRCLRAGRLSEWKNLAGQAFSKLVKQSFSDYELSVEANFSEDFCGV